MREVSDSLHLRRFCRIALTERVPDESTVRKLTRRLGPEVIDEITRAVIDKAAARAALRRARGADRLDRRGGRRALPQRRRAGRRRDPVLAREARKVTRLAGKGARGVRDRSRAAARKLREISRTVARRTGQAKSDRAAA